MSKQNKLENKRIRRAEREANAAIQRKKRLTQRVFNYEIPVPDLQTGDMEEHTDE